MRLAVRGLVKSPGFSLPAVLMLGLGIGANTLIFSATKGILLRPLPFVEAHELVKIWESNLTEGVAQIECAPGNFLEWQRQGGVFESMAAFHELELVFTGSGEPEQIRGIRVTPDFFQVLRSGPLHGHLVVEGTEERAVVLSHSLWSRRFGGDAGVVGKAVTINQEPYVVAAVMPADFEFPPDGEAWVPRPFDALESQSHEFQFLDVIARLREGTTLEQARSVMGNVARRLEQDYPDSNTGWGVKLVALRDDIVGAMRPRLLILLGSGAFVLLLSCANVANLLLARTIGRQRDIALRSAIGAGRRALVGQFLTENLVLVAAGAVLGLLLSSWGLRILTALAPPEIPRVEEVVLDGGVLAFALLISVATVAILSLIPSFMAAAPNLEEFLKEGGLRASAGRGRRRLQDVILVLEVALAFTLVIGAGLLVKSFWSLQRVDPGYDFENILTMEVELPRAKYPEGHQQVAFFDQTFEALRRLPGVEAVAGSTTVPLEGSGLEFSFEIPGRPQGPSGEPFNAGFDSVTADYLQTLGIGLVGGRYFSATDDSRSPAVAIINRTLARRYWGEDDPVGEHLTVLLRDRVPREIIGVVEDIKHSSLIAEPRAEIYVPFEQFPIRSLRLAIKTTRDPMRLVGEMRRTILSVDSEQPVSDVETMARLHGASMARERFTMALLGAFAAVGLLVGAVGVHSVMAYAVAQRIHEIGIRMALGATQAGVLRLVLSRGCALVLIGLAAGMLASLSLGGFLRGLLFEVTETDALTFVGTSVLLIAIAALAILVPARRAATVPPTIALRSQ